MVSHIIEAIKIEGTVKLKRVRVSLISSLCLSLIILQCPTLMVSAEASTSSSCYVYVPVAPDTSVSNSCLSNIKFTITKSGSIHYHWKIVAYPSHRGGPYKPVYLMLLVEAFLEKALLPTNDCSFTKDGMGTPISSGYWPTEADACNNFLLSGPLALSGSGKYALSVNGKPWATWTFTEPTVKTKGK